MGRSVARTVRWAAGEVPFYAALLGVVFFLLFPFYWGFITSLKFEKEIFDFTGNILWVRNPSLANYETLFKTPRFARWLWNTSIVSVVTTAVSVVVSVMGGYAIARLKFRGVTAASVIVFVTYLAPKGLLFVPLAQVLNEWGLLGGLPSLMLTYPTFLIPFCTWLLSGYFIIPVAIPGILSAGIFAFTLSWNEFIYALVFLSSPQQKTVPVGVVSELIRGDVFFWGALMAGALLGSIPVAIAYSFFVEHYVSGLTGSVKG